MGQIDFNRLTIKSLLTLMESGISAETISLQLKERIKEFEHLNCFISTIDNLKASHKQFVPVAIKDNFMLENTYTTCASKMLENFCSPYTSTVVERLSKFSYFVGKANMDEFAMGSSGKTSYFGKTFSPWKNNEGEVLSPGGSSSGPASSVAASLALFSIGTDTGGSVRIPAAFSGLVGLKPTYGSLSRFGVVEFSSFLDCVGCFSKTVWDMQWAFYQLIGKDKNDPTSFDYKKQSSKKNIAIFLDESCNLEIQQKIMECKLILESNGYRTYFYNIPFLEYILPIYYIISSSDASSNLARYNGPMYGQVNEKISEHRSKCFGTEVKRRILLGNYVLQAAHHDDFYSKAMKILTVLNETLNEVWKNTDCILMPSTSGYPLTMKQADNPDPIAMYKCDVYTCLANLLGLPAMNIPVGMFKNSTPMGLQLLSKPMGENLIFEAAQVIDEKINFWHNYCHLLEKK